MWPSLNTKNEFGIPPFYFLLPYFRIVATPALLGPIGLAGTVYLVRHISWNGATVFGIAALTSFAIRNAPLFWKAIGDKLEIVRFLDRNEGIALERIPPDVLTENFDAEAFIPSFLKTPGWIKSHLLRDRIQIYLVKSTDARTGPASSFAASSSIALDSYVFLRGDPRDGTSFERYRLGHELGHVSAIHASHAQRTTIGMICVYASIVWLFVNVSWTSILLAWSALELFAAWFIGRTVWKKLAERGAFNAEIVADYCGLRDMPRSMLPEFLSTFGPEDLTEPDPALTPEQRAMRRAIMAKQIDRLKRGEDIDIPPVFMQGVFDHPFPLVSFAFLHFFYICFFAASNEFSPIVAGFCLVPIMLLYLLGAWIDTLVRAEIRERTDRAEREALLQASQ